MKKIKAQNGITLIALIITIAVLGILASISISSVKNDGVIGHAKNEKNKYNETVEDFDSTVNSLKDKLKNDLTLENTVINENNIVPGPIPTPSECEHEWNTGIETTSATCTTTGVKTYTCIKCSTTTTETIDALGHDLKISETNATCTTAGTTKTYCTRCSYTNTKTGEALGHDLDSGTVTTAATCTKSGVKTYSCKRNGCSYTKTETIDALGHNLKISETNATCTTAGTTTTYCTRTGCSYSNTTTGTALGHDLDSGTVTTAATCTTDGVKTYSCKRTGCNYTTTETITKLGHDYSREIARAANERTDATCTAKATYWTVCSRCSSISTTKYFEYGEPLGHVWQEMATDWGNRRHYYNKQVCTRSGCGVEEAKTENTRLENHTYYEYYSTYGSYKSSYCNTCGKTCTHPNRSCGICIYCGEGSVSHSWSNGVCSDCGTCQKLSKYWRTESDTDTCWHYCDACGAEISHDATNEKCSSYPHP